MNTPTPVKMGVVALSSVFLLTACGDDGGTTTTEAPETAQSQSSQSSQSSEAVSEGSTQAGFRNGNQTGDEMGINEIDFSTSLDDAIQIFGDTFPTPSIESIQFTEEDGFYIYDIDGFDEENQYSMQVHADSGEILQREEEQDDGGDSDDALNLGNIISPEEAMSIALEEAGSGYVQDWELNREDDTTFYELDLEETNGLFDDDDIEVDAQSGEVLDR